MSHYLYSVRDRFHPVHHLRRFAPSRAILKLIDVPVWTKMPGVNWKVRAQLVRHASAVILPGGAEPSISALFSALNREFGISTFWDVGSNVGYYAWLVKSVAPLCQVRLFEPDPNNAALIRATMHRAHLTGAVLREVAVSDGHCERSFVRDDISGLTGGILDFGIDFSRTRVGRQWKHHEGSDGHG